MNKYVIIGTVVLFVTLSGFACIPTKRFQSMRDDRNIYRSNSYALFERLDIYRVQDSLQAVSVRSLELKTSEYERFRQSDMRLIEQLKVDNKRIESVVTAQTKTIYELKLKIRDSVVYRDNYIVDTLRCMEYHDKWLDFVGCASGDSSSVKIANRDSLTLVEHVVPKRFLGFLWKYGVKERRLDAVSKNAHTEILGIELITIRK
jgi:hypothetical protein